MARAEILAPPRRLFEQAIHFALGACAVVSILTTVGIVIVLIVEAAQFFREVSVVEFLTDTKWSPLFEPQHFGILPLFCGTFLVTAGAAVVVLPIGLATAIYLSEYATRPIREIVKPVLEVLAGIPSVVFGYLAIVMISPHIRDWFGTNSIYSAASASVVVGFMILPMVVSLSEDVLRSVPRSLREAAYALATKLDVTVKVVVPAAVSGIMASFLLALSRAIGETMAVALAAGARAQLTLNPLDEVETMTAYIVRISMGDTPAGTLEYRTIFAVGLTLFITTMTLNVLAQWIVSRVRERYD